MPRALPYDAARARVLLGRVPLGMVATVEESLAVVHVIERDEIEREPWRRPLARTRFEVVRTCCASVSAFATLLVLLHVYGVA